MATNSQAVLDPRQLNEADRAILDELKRGRASPSYLSERIDIEQTYINQRLRRLDEHGHVENLARGLWELADDPRDDDAEPPDTPDAGDLETEIRDLQSELSRVRNERDECREQLATLDTHASVEIEQARDALERALEDDAWTPVEDAAHYLGVEVDR